MEIMTKEEIVKLAQVRREEARQKEMSAVMEEIYPKYKEHIDSFFNYFDKVIENKFVNPVRMKRIFNYDFVDVPVLLSVDSWFKEYRKTRPEMKGMKYSNIEKEAFYCDELKDKIKEREEAKCHNTQTKKDVENTARDIATFFTALGYRVTVADEYKHSEWCSSLGGTVGISVSVSFDVPDKGCPVKVCG